MSINRVLDVAIADVLMLQDPLEHRFAQNAQRLSLSLPNDSHNSRNKVLLNNFISWKRCFPDAMLDFRRISMSWR